jgi:hypothetical protein
VSAVCRITMIYQTLAKVFLICSGGAIKPILSEAVVPRFCRQESKSMDRTQATQIRSLLLEAADAIDHAIISTLDSDDRALLAAPLDEISSALHFELLQKLYLRYPRLPRKAKAGTAPWHEPSGAQSFTSPTTACRRSNWRRTFRRTAA